MGSCGMTPLTKQLIITTSITALIVYVVYYIALAIITPIQYATLECNKTCFENAGGPMPTSGLISIVAILIIIAFIIGVLWYWGDFPKEKWDELVKGKKE